MDSKWPQTFSTRWTRPEKRASINVNVSRDTQVQSIKRKKKCFETLWIIYPRREIKVKDKRATYSPKRLSKSYFIFFSRQILFFKPIRTWSHIMTNILAIFNYEFLKVCIINKMYHIPWTLLSDKEKGRKQRL